MSLKRVIGYVGLFLLGWKWPNSSDMKVIISVRRAVTIFTHTSYWDIVFLVLYHWTNPGISGLYFPVAPQFFKRSLVAKVLESLGGIPSTKAEEKGKGFVSTVIEMYGSRSDFRFTISPKGMLARPKNYDWKAGYYFIATGMNIPVVTVGVDYEKRELVLCDILNLREYPGIYGTIDHELSTRKVIMKSVGQIIPLHPELEVVPLRQYSKHHIGAMSLSWLIMMSTVLSLVFGASLAQYLSCTLIIVVVLLYGGALSLT